LGNVTINVILSLFRIIEGYVRFDLKAFCLHKKVDGGDDESRRSTLSEVLIVGGETTKPKIKKINSFKSKFNILSISGKGGVNFCLTLGNIYERHFCWINSSCK